MVLRFYRGYLREFVDGFRRGGSTDIASYLLCMFQVTLSHKPQMLALHHAGASHLLLPALADAFGAKRLEGTTDPRLRYAIAYHVGGIYNDMLLWFDRDMAETPSRCATWRWPCVPRARSHCWTSDAVATTGSHNPDLPVTDFRVTYSKVS